MVDDVATRMQVEILTGGALVVQQCDILSSSTLGGELECRTTPATQPLNAAGVLCSVRLSAIDASGAVLSSVTMASAYLLAPLASSLLVSSLSSLTGSDEGGLLLCISGQNLDRNQSVAPTVLVGTAACDTTNATWSASTLCCSASAHTRRAEYHIATRDQPALDLATALALAAHAHIIRLLCHLLGEE